MNEFVKIFLLAFACKFLIRFFKKQFTREGTGFAGKPSRAYTRGKWLCH